MRWHCYHDEPLLRHLDAALLVAQNLTHQQCLDFCHTKKTLYAGITIKKFCFCGDQKGKYKRLPNNRCRQTCPGDKQTFCGGTSSLTLTRTNVDKPFRPTSPYAIAGLCSPGYSTASLNKLSLGEYSHRHNLDLHYFDGPLEPLYPLPFSKLTVLQRMLSLGYKWTWWVDCDALLIDPAVPFADLIARYGGLSKPEPIMLAGYEPWGWTKEHNRQPSHPISTGSFFFRGSDEGLRILREWARHCPAVKSHKLWEQHALTHLLRPELVHGGVRTPLRLGNDSIYLLANPAYNALLCPTERTFAEPPVVIHVPRGVLSVGSCEPGADHHIARAAGYEKYGAWKAVLLSRIALQGLQAVRNECCASYKFEPRLFRKIWNGSVGTVNRSDYAPNAWGNRSKPHGKLQTINGVSTNEIASAIKSCGVSGNIAPLVVGKACANSSYWIRKNNRLLTTAEVSYCHSRSRPRLCAWCKRHGRHAFGSCAAFFPAAE